MFENLEERKERSKMMNEFIGELLDMMCEKTDDKRFIFAKHERSIINKMNETFDLVTDNALTEDKIDKLISIFQQMENLIDDVINNKG